MREIYFTELLPDIVLRLHGERKSIGPPIFLTIPPDFPAFSWQDNGLEILIFNLFSRAISVSDLERPIRVAVASRRVTDLEALLNIHPAHWIQMRIDVQSVSDPDDSIIQELGNSGYYVEDEWIAEGMPGRLIAYHQMNQTGPQLLLWIEHHRAGHRYAIIIPVQAGTPS